MLSVHDRASLLLQAARNVAMRAASLPDDTPLHKAADRHLDAMTLAVMYAFLKGRKAYKDGGDAPTAIRAALRESLPPVLRKAMATGGETALGALRTAGDVEGHEFHGNQWTTGGGQSASEHFKTSKGTDAAANNAIVKENGVRVKASDAERPIVEEALAHVITDSKTNAELLKGKTVEVKDLGNRHGNMSASLYVDSKTVKQEGAGFTAAIIYHELQHAILTKEKVPSHQQEDRVRYKTKFWATMKAGNMAKTNPSSSKGFEKAARQSRPTRTLEEFRTLKPQRPGKPHTKVGPIGLAFNVADPRAIKWAEEHAAELADGLSETSDAAIKAAVARAVAGGGVRAAREDILAAVGDEARARMIARTEVMTAANEGQRQGWQQAADAGLLPRTARVEWIATEGCCDLCDALDGTERSLDGEYDDPDAGDGPPLHPNCRCTEGLAS